MPADTTSVSIRMSARVISRIEKSAERLELPVSMVLERGVREVARLVHEGWRPGSVPAAGEVQFFLRLPRQNKVEIERIAEAAGVTFVDLARIAAWAALLQMEASPQIRWPLIFSERCLKRGLAAAAA